MGRRMRPLIVYCLSGGPYLEMVELSLQSLVSLGCYEGEVLIVTEARSQAVRRAVPTSRRLRTTIRQADFGRSSRRALLSRFAIHDHPIVCRRAPVLYVDADILFDAPVMPMLSVLHGLDRIAFAAEVWTDRNRDVFMGAELTRFAGLSTAGHGLNSGTIGIPNGADARHRVQLADIGETTAVLGRCFPDKLGHTHDQAVLTFLQARNGHFDIEALTPFIQFNGGPVADPRASCKGLVHFLYDGKVERMRQHLDGLRAVEPRSRWPSLFGLSSLAARPASGAEVAVTSNNLW